MKGSAPRTPGPHPKQAGHTRAAGPSLGYFIHVSVSLTPSGANHSLPQDSCGTNEGTGIQVLVFTLEVYDLTSSPEEGSDRKLSCKETNRWPTDTDTRWALSAFSFSLGGCLPQHSQCYCKERQYVGRPPALNRNNSNTSCSPDGKACGEGRAGVGAPLSCGVRGCHAF